MHVLIWGMGRLGNAIARYSELKGYQIETVTSKEASPAEKLSSNHFDILFLCVDPKRMRSSIPEIFETIISSRISISVVATPFELANFASSCLAEAVRISCSPGLGACIGFGGIFVEDEASASAHSTLQHWADRIPYERIARDEFEDAETAFAFCGFAAAALTRFSKMHHVNSNNKAYQFAARELISLMANFDADPKAAFKATATPGGIVDTSVADAFGDQK